MKKSINFPEPNPTNKIKNLLKIPFLVAISDQQVFEENLEKLTHPLSVYDCFEAWTEFKRIQNWSSSLPTDDLTRILSAKPFTHHKGVKMTNLVWMFSIDYRIYFIGFGEYSEGIRLNGVKDCDYENEDIRLSDIKLISSKLYQGGSS